MCPSVKDAGQKGLFQYFLVHTYCDPSGASPAEQKLKESHYSCMYTQELPEKGLSSSHRPSHAQDICTPQPHRAQKLPFFPEHHQAWEK